MPAADLLGGAATQLLHAALMLAAAPWLAGLLRWARARLVGRTGVVPHQPFRELARALRRQPVVAENASPLFLAAPVLCLCATAAAALLVPSFALGMSSAPIADLLVIAGLLTLARGTLALAAMDVGTAFGGIGASRTLAYAVFAEPALLLVTLTLTLLAGTTGIDAIATLVREGGFGLRVSMGLALAAIVIVALTENDRIPAGNPATHLELTMVHEAMVLEFSGWHLALLELAASLRLLLWLDLIAALFVPFGIAPAGSGPVAWAVGLSAWAAKVAMLAAGLAVAESLRARMRLFLVPEFLGLAVLLGLVAAVFLFFSQGFA